MRPEILHRERAHQARIEHGGERFVRRHAGAGERVEDVGVVDLLGLQVALGLSRGGGEREAAADAALGYPGAEGHQGERVVVDTTDDAVGEPCTMPAMPPLCGADADGLW